MPEQTQDFKDLVYRCYLRRDYKACRLVEFYMAMGMVRARLEDELKEFEVKFPIGPDPSPEMIAKWRAEGDPDGNPARFFAVADRERVRDRIEIAVKIHGALKTVAGELEANINELKAQKP